ncbi:hypothetical protein [Paracoccus chinensis]|uniref:Uncharacterized protein n=1 Tax=Paracoccus chinensis TaxID=525640 RepID=A0A1G9ISL9_9RHOB|nr:hypothetical protein [Paracoccus chinensis]SDL28065.1 hypothetical protein SAMN04487971_108115 [Paracoccus chinensis]
MAKETSPRKIEISPPLRQVKRPATTDELVERLLNARNSNEIAAVIGLPPITGLSGPKIAY